MKLKHNGYKGGLFYLIALFGDKSSTSSVLHIGQPSPWIYKLLELYKITELLKIGRPVKKTATSFCYSAHLSTEILTWQLLFPPFWKITYNQFLSANDCYTDYFWDISSAFFFSFIALSERASKSITTITSTWNFQTHVSACFLTIFCWIVITSKERKSCIQQQVQSKSKDFCLFSTSHNSTVAFPITYPKSTSRRTVAAKFFRQVKAESWKAITTPTQRVTGTM